MPLARFSVSLDAELVRRFDRKIRAERCPTRSKAIGDLIRAHLVESEWRTAGQVAGALVLVYDHRQRELVRRLMEIQHEGQEAIISTQHVHLDHANCLEIIAVRGKPAVIRRLMLRLKAVKGVKHVALAATSAGRQLT